MINCLYLPTLSKQDFLNHHLLSTFSNNNNVKSAITFAETIHKTQIRDSGDSYLTQHIYPVARDVIEEIPSNLLSEDIAVTAILHDAIERCDYIDGVNLRQKFSNNVLNWLRWISKTHGWNPIADTHLYEPIRDYFYHMKLKKAPWQVILIKICDRFNNLTCSFINYRNGKDLKKGKEFLKETKNYYLKFSQKVDAEIGSKTYNQLSSLVDKFEKLIDATETKSATTNRS